MICARRSPSWHCGTEQDDRDLHAEPGDLFFDIPHAPPRIIRLSPLIGEVRLTDDVSGQHEVPRTILLACKGWGSRAAPRSRLSASSRARRAYR